jgi:Aspartyl/Asparaginyl beta-hydroxylase
MIPIKLIARNLPVAQLQQDLLDHPELWNAHSERKSLYAHTKMSDIWVRYNADHKDLSAMQEPHDSVWYPSYESLPGLKQLIFPVMQYVEGERLGGVLITHIPPGSQVLPHVDSGWHANYYDKFAVQIAGGDGQGFHFEDASLVSQTGDLFTFDNSKSHWVTNESDFDRITLIICIKTNHKTLRVRTPDAGGE